MSELSRPDASIPRDQELQIRFALHAAGIGTWDVDIVNRQIVMDDRCRSLFRLEVGEVPTYESVIRHIHPVDQPAIREVITQALQPTSDHLFNVRFRSITEDNKNVLWLNVKGQAYFNSEGQAIRLSGISQDVSAEVLANEKAQAAEKMAALAIEGSDAGIFTVDLVNNTIEFSPSLYYIVTGNREAPVKNRDVLISHVHPDDKALREQAYEKAALTGYLQYEARFVWDDGSIHWAKLRGKYEYDISGNPVSFSGICLETTAQKEQDRLLKEVEHNKLLEYQTLLEQEVAERTEELAASNEELAAMNEELQDANFSLVRSNQELEQYAYVASHDLQEPLRKIRIYADLLNKQEGLPIHHKRLVEKINQSSERMSMLIKDLLEFSRLLEKGNMTREVDLTIILQSVISDFELIIEEKQAEIIVGPLPVIQGIPLQINQLFYNLMSNALKFTHPGVRPLIRINAIPITGEVARNYLNKSDRYRQYFDISFSDNGIGFDEKYADQIFEVFKRLHNRALYPGSGIGLSLCRRIVANHAGHLFVESTQGKGTTFRIILPGV